MHHATTTMPSQKNKQKSNDRREDRDEIPIVDTDTLAMTIIALFGDAPVAVKLKKGYLPTRTGRQARLPDKTSLCANRMSERAR